MVSKVPRYDTTDTQQLQVVIGNQPDTVFNTSTGNEPPAQFRTVDAWELSGQTNSTNVTNQDQFGINVQ